MAGVSDTQIDGQLMESARDFLTEFASFAGRRGVTTAMLVMAGALVEGVGLVLLVPMFAVIIQAKASSGVIQRTVARLFAVIGVSSNTERLGLLLVLFATVMLVRAVIILNRDVSLSRLQVGFVESQRGEIIDRLAAASWQSVSRLRHARISQVMSGDIQRLGGAAQFLLQSATALIMLVAQAALAMLISPVLTSLALLMIGISGLALIPLLRRSHSQGAYIVGANLNLLDTTTQFMGGLKLALSQNLQQSFVVEFRDVLSTLTSRQIAFTRQQSSSRLIRATGAAFVGAGVVFIGYSLLGAAPAVLMTVLLILSRMNGPVTQIQQGLQQLAQTLPAYGAIRSLKLELARTAAATPEPADRGAALPDGPIVFAGVRFRHAPGEAQAGGGVDDLDLIIPPGAVVGIAGASGAGKTTFADLLTGLLPPERGKITVGGRALTDAAMARWREGLTYVSQDPFLFHDTVRRNLLWARPDASEEELWDALELCGADQLVRGMPQGLDTVVGERGSFVSGGERQRIALARGLIRRPKLLILDEATSAIDVAGERAFMERLFARKPHPTIVMIAHRAESLGHCDLVYVFERGRAEVQSRTPA